MAMNAAVAYQGNKIRTATPAERTLMLYEGAIKFCNIALMAMEKKDVQKVHYSIMRAENIVIGLRETLDFKYPVAKDFDQVYEYIYQRLVDSNLSKDMAALEEALGHIREMRDTWKEVMKLAR